MNVLDTDIIERNGRRFKVERIDDSSDGATPWEDDEGVGIITRQYLRHTHGNMKKPGQRPMNSPGWQESQFLYDWQETMKKARADGWGLTADDIAVLTQKLGRVPTKRQIVAESVQRDFDHHRRFIEGQWHYIGVQVTLLTLDEEEDEEEHEFSESCWRIESDGDYWKEIMEELISTLETDADERDAAQEQERMEQEAYEMAEAAEVQYWAERDVVTA